MKKPIHIQAKVWKFNGHAAWYFVNLDKGISAKIRESAIKKSMGMVKVEAKIKKVTWGTSLFWSKRDESYILPLKKKIRYEVGILEGDTLKISLKLL
jgi:hypothetical protein